MSLPLPSLLQLAGEAGDFGGVQVGPDVLDAERARRLVLGLGRPGVERPDVFLAPEPPFRAVRPRLQIDALRVAGFRVTRHRSPPYPRRARGGHARSDIHRRATPRTAPSCRSTRSANRDPIPDLPRRRRPAPAAARARPPVRGEVALRPGRGATLARAVPAPPPPRRVRRMLG